MSATIAPSNPEPVLIRLAGTDTIEVPDGFTIPAAGQGSFEVRALQIGTFTVIAMLPEANGNETASIAGRVVELPPKPTITGISPAFGSPAGGSSVEVQGALLRTDCTLTFGDVPASSLVFVSETLLTATTPPHPAGAVDVSLLCGSDLATLSSAFLYRPLGRTRAVRH